MKKIIMSCLVFATAFSAFAQDNKGSVTERANRLTDQMIRELRLNNFQANRLRAINQDKVSKMMAIEQRDAKDPVLVDKNCKGVCKERDQELEGILSSDQYSLYYGARNKYYKEDKDFAAQIGSRNNSTAQNNKPTLPLGEKVIPVKKSTVVLRPDDSK